MDKPFVHLHTHSHYSLLDGLTKISPLVNKAAEYKMPALALTDHGSMYGIIDFYKAAHEANIKPIIGMEGYLARNRMQDKRPKIDDRPYHLTILAKNLTGYHNLMKLTTRSHLEGYYYKPRFDLECLEEHHEGLIILSGCLNGPLARTILDENPEATRQFLDYFQRVFGEDFYCEMQKRPSLPQQDIVNQALLRVSQERGIPLVATNDSHYLNPDDADAQDILLCIHTKNKREDKDRLTMMGEDISLRPSDYMRALFDDVPGACDATLDIANKCNVELDFKTYHIPQFAVPEKRNADDYLRDLCLQGLPRRYGIDPEKPDSDEHTHAVLDRLQYELDIIQKMGFSSYFLIVQDFVNWAKDQGIVVGPGRGSAAGSIVSYLTNITNLDPLHYDLLFERFLNPDRISMPDIDLDFTDTRRDEVIQYVRQKYGENNVAHIITFGTMAARAAIRDVGRVMGLSYSFCDRMSKMIPMFTTLDEALTRVPEFKQLYASDAEAKELIDSARKLEGVARHTSLHACGIVITEKPLWELVPVQHISNTDHSLVTQYSLYPVESLGLLKMDFLGLKNLTIIENTIDIITKTIDMRIDIDAIPLDDPKTYTLLQAAETVGVFQIESSGMQRYLKQLKPTELEDIIVMVSLYRPGPMEFIPDYIAGKHGRKKPHFIHPKLKPVLEKTYGIAVYQEQIMQIARDLAGFTYAEADVLRKAVGKKIKKLLDEQEDKMIRGMVANGIDKKTAATIWEFIIPFARYGFNRSHAACYAMIAYQTAYLKANFPAQFMAALLTSDQDNSDRVAIEITECRRLGIEILPPDINESYSTFTVVRASLEKTPRIRFGLEAIKNVGSGVIRVIIDERKNNGPYESLENFLERVQSKDLNKKSLEALAMCGALDSVAERNRVLENMDLLLQYTKNIHRDKDMGQDNLFSNNGLRASVALQLKQAAPATDEQRLSWEKQLLGLYISAHPMTAHQDALKAFGAPIAEALKLPNEQRVTIGGIITHVQRKITRNGQSMAFVKIEDATGEVEVLVFPKLLEAHPELWEEDTMVVVNGTMSDKDAQRKILGNAAAELNMENPEATRNDLLVSESVNGGRHRNTSFVLITIPRGTARASFESLKKYLQTIPGPDRVVLRIKGERVAVSVAVRYNQEAKQQIEQLLGVGTTHFVRPETHEKNYRYNQNQKNTSA